MNNLPDLTKAKPWMRQQYTYLDLKAAFEAGVRDDSRKMIGTYLSFEDWIKSYKFEMINGPYF